jgi:hypothetical protein
MDFLISALESTWPLVAGAIVVAEGLMFLRKKYGLKPMFIVALLVAVGFTGAAYLMGPSYSKASRPFLYGMVSLLSVLGPLAVIVLVIHSVQKLKVVAAQVLVLGSTLGVMFVWPIWALLIACFSGDCL